ncbi:MAG: hypothetical protein ACSLFR_00400 [Solirubrobacteraceae bacterium]
MAPAAPTVPPAPVVGTVLAGALVHASLRSRFRHFAFAAMTRSRPFAFPAFFTQAVTVTGGLVAAGWPVTAHAPPPSARNTAMVDMTFA